MRFASLEDSSRSKTSSWNIVHSHFVSVLIPSIGLARLQPEIPKERDYIKGRIHSINNSKHDYLFRYAALQLKPQESVNTEDSVILVACLYAQEHACFKVKLF